MKSTVRAELARQRAQERGDRRRALLEKAKSKGAPVVVEFKRRDGKRGR